MWPTLLVSGSSTACDASRSDFGSRWRSIIFPSDCRCVVEHFIIYSNKERKLNIVIWYTYGVPMRSRLCANRAPCWASGWAATAITSVQLIPFQLQPRDGRSGFGGMPGYSVAWHGSAWCSRLWGPAAGNHRNMSSALQPRVNSQSGLYRVIKCKH